MKGFSVSRLLSLAAILAVAAACAGAGAAKPERPPQAVLMQATGDLRLSNSADGQAIFQASGLAPGRSVTGTVQLTNSGTLPGDLSLQQLDVSDNPGPGGGRLSNVVTLDIADVTGGSSIPVFSGQLGGLGSRPLGAIGPGETRTFRFTASLPDMDNAFAGSGLTVRYAWNATAAGGGPGPSEQPVAKFKLNSKKLLKRRFLDVTATCNIACRISAQAQLPKAGARQEGPEEQRPHRHAHHPEPARPHPAEDLEEGAARAQAGPEEEAARRREGAAEREPRRRRNRHPLHQEGHRQGAPSASAARR